MSARNLLSSALVVAAFALPLGAQTPAPAPRPSFEVASIKRNLSVDSSGGSRTTPGGRVTITNESLRSIIRGAYGQDDLEVIGGPPWIDSDKWNIAATAGSDQAGQPTQPMMQTLLADRFKLVAHVETREQPVYAMVMARADRRRGPQLHSSSMECNFGGPCGTRSTTGQMAGTAVTMADLAKNLFRYAERRVVDRTGLGGRFDFTFAWMDGESIFTALQEQLGLKLESQRGPVDVVVVDSVERATED